MESHIHTPPTSEPHPLSQTLAGKIENDHPRRFDRSIYNQITGLDARLLELIDYDSRQQAKRSPTGARYSVKPQAWYAKVLGVCRETISDHIRHLESVGILDVTRRRQVKGAWQTNLLKIRSWVWWRLGKLLRSLRRTPNRVTQVSHISIPMRERKPTEEVPPHALLPFADAILERWRLRGERFAAKPT